MEGDAEFHGRPGGQRGSRVNGDNDYCCFDCGCWQAYSIDALAVVVEGHPGYRSIGMNHPCVRRDFEKQGSVVIVSRSEAVRGFHEYAASHKGPDR
jgi:hypothetical protein